MTLLVLTILLLKSSHSVRISLYRKQRLIVNEKVIEIWSAFLYDLWLNYAATTRLNVKCNKVHVVPNYQFGNN